MRGRGGAGSAPGGSRWRRAGAQSGAHVAFQLGAAQTKDSHVGRDGQGARAGFFVSLRCGMPSEGGARALGVVRGRGAEKWAELQVSLESLQTMVMFHVGRGGQCARAGFFVPIRCGMPPEGGARALRVVRGRGAEKWAGVLSHLRQQILHMLAVFCARATEDLVVGYRVPCRMRSGARERERAGALCGRAQQQRGQSRGAGMRRTWSRG